jgi:hypothetical protein
MNDAPVSITTLLFFFGGGFFCLAFGLAIRLGLTKQWWLVYDTPLTPSAWAYWSIPFSVVLFTMGCVVFIPDIETRRRAFLYVGFFGFIPSLILAMIRPRWLVPPWLRWLEDNHRGILSLLKYEARKMGGNEWNRRVRTQAGLEEWVAEVRRKQKG